MFLCYSPPVQPDCPVSFNEWWHTRLLYNLYEEFHIEHDSVREGLSKQLAPYFERDSHKCTSVKEVSEFYEVLRQITVLYLDPLDDQDGLCSIS